MTTQVKDMAQQAAPWRRDVNWMVVLVEGILALILGIYILVQPGQAGNWIVFLIGAYLLVNSVIRLYRAFSGRSGPVNERFDALDGGIGFFAGALVFLEPLVIENLDTAGATVILTYALFLLGVLDLINVGRSFSQAGMRWGLTIVGLIKIGFAVLLVFVLRTGEAQGVLNIFGWTFTVLGALLAIYGIVLNRSQSAKVADAGEAA